VYRGSCCEEKTKTMKFFTREVKIGLTAIIAIVIIYFGIVFLKGLTLSKSNNFYYVEMEDVNGLSVTADVMVNGVKVGTVKEMTFIQQTQKVVVKIELEENFKVPVGSQATLVKDMLGAPKMKVMLGTNPSLCLNQGDTITGFPMSDLMTAAGEMVPKVDALLPKLDSILTALNTVVSDPAIANSLHNVEALTADLRTTTHSLGQVMNNQVPNLLNNVNKVVSTAGTAADNLAKTTSHLQEMDFNGLMTNAYNAVDNLQSFTDKLNNPNSSLGLLMNDNSVYNHLDSTANNAALLLQDLRENPKRYVHFSLFGRKDKK